MYLTMLKSMLGLFEAYRYIRKTMGCVRICLYVFCFNVNLANAVDVAKLEVGNMVGQDWQLQGVKLSVNNLKHRKSQFSFSATKMLLPKPFQDLTLANITCAAFTWQQEEVQCKQGKAAIKSATWQEPKTDFSFHLSPNKTVLKLQNAQFAGSRLALDLQAIGNNWHATVTNFQASNQFVDALLQGKLLPIKPTQTKQATQGNFVLSGTISGFRDTVQKFDLTIHVDQLTDQTADAKLASENLKLLTHIAGQNIKTQQWAWQSETKMLGGVLYIEPIYLEAGTLPIVLQAKGAWGSDTKRADVQSFSYQHPGQGTLTGSAALYYRNGVKVDTADLNLASDTLQGLATTYIKPFVSEALFSGLTLAGEVQSHFAFNGTTLTDSSIRFGKLNIYDAVGRLQVIDGTGLINWSDDQSETKQSELNWQKLTVKGLPIKASGLKFNSQGWLFFLAEKVKLPVFNGAIAIDKFSWQGKAQDAPDIDFAGAINDISLEQLSKKMGWTPLSGNISGNIPGVAYRDNRLLLDGELKINVFNGAIKVKNLTASQLFSALPQVSGDMEVTNLDLAKLTRKFEFGNISGRLSGYVNKIVLENWRPVTFFAWLGTPDDDDSSHRISQKAVKNIASIGGGGASDVLSRSFLGFFETFGYDKIGVGCYLHNGVCQMMGLEATGDGYYLIKGGGLPRIDVLGYNTQINWDVLVERLGRVATPNNAIIQ